ncbi:MAG TPA: gephyrin-like molybdotransferase Glp [Thermoleophilia bacterium]|nr:gephyrin-like molybdotransferase Glp [Thermoleophilia bacterium]
MTDIDEALDLVLSAVRPLPAEEVPLLEALGRAAAGSIVSTEPVPAFDNSAMDGYALRSVELEAGRREFRVVVDIPAGRWVDQVVGEGAAAKIMTGAPVPPGVDTVVPVELTEQHGDRLVVHKGVPAGANVRSAAEDIAAGAVLLERGALLAPADIGLLASVGHRSVLVTRRPRVAILATGSELVSLGRPLGPGQIRNSNSATAYGQVLAAAGDPLLLGIAPDDLTVTRRLISAALDQDVVITSGGVSVGEYDFVKQVQDELGVQRRFWGVAMKPGKPLAFGTRGDTLVFGVPGNPVSAMVCFELYVRPALLALQGRTDLYRPYVHAVAEESMKASRRRTELRRCRLVRRQRGWAFTTTGPQGSGILRSMSQADGLVVVPPEHPKAAPGDEFLVMLLDGRAVERPPFPRGGTSASSGD